MTGYVYAIQAVGRPENPIKIGHSTDPARRLKGIQTGSHEQLQILATTPGTKADEAGLHRRFSDHRLSGEWFSYSPDILEWLYSIGYCPWRLYWVSDHGCEDWFMIARSEGEAEECHEDVEGFDPGTASAEEICRVPPFVDIKHAGWPTPGQLLVCGAIFVHSETPRTVRIGDRVFREGTMQWEIDFNTARARAIHGRDWFGKALGL